MSETTETTILIVDDSEINIDIMAETIGDTYEVAVAMDGQTAIEIASEIIPDLILLDVMMPDMDGYEVCRQLKSNPATADILVIFVTAKSETEDEIRGFELGGVDFITKPISPPVAMRRIASALALKQQNDQLADLSSKLGKYLSPQVYESIFSGAQDVAIGGTRKKLTVFLSDIVEFTATTEKMEPEDMTRLLNNYLDSMAQIAMKHGGTIDKFIGDAIMVFFGDPHSHGPREDALACVRMALDMEKELQELQKQWFDSGIEKPFKVRMGINTGYCTVGNFGSTNRMDYTIIGSQVNAAARLEQNAEPGQILISHETWSLVKDEVLCVPRSPIRVKGISNAIPTYKVVGERRSQEKATLQANNFISPAHIASPDTPIREITMLLKNADPYDAIIIATDAGPLGTISRAALDATLCSDSDKALYYEQPVEAVMDDKPVIVKGDAPLDQVARKMSGRSGWESLTPAVVVDDGGILGVLLLPTVLEQLVSMAECTM